MLASLAKAGGTEVPATFLPPPNAAVRRALQKPVSGDFHAEPVRQVFGALFQQLPANVVITLHNPIEPTFTGKFAGVPFRTAIFVVAKATACQIEWTVGSDGTRLIRIHD